MIGIYIHIPFCKSKCPYCNFTSEVGDSAKDYISALKKEIQNHLGICTDTVDTIFIGGGTPTAIEPVYIESVLSEINKNVPISKTAEITIEANPGTLDMEKALKYRKMGINRISFGVQSTNDNELLTLGRIHTYSEFLNSYECAKKVGFDNINIDLMFGTPYQTIDSFNESLENILALNPTHISAYALKIEKGTPFYKDYYGHTSLPCEDIERDMYHLAHDLLRSKGYIHYETSNFAKPNFECKHNLKYWTQKPYYGFGVSAHSFIIDEEKYIRYGNTDSIDGYILNIENDKAPVGEKDILSDIDIKQEFIMLNLRLNTGIAFSEFKTRFGIDFEKEYNPEIENLITNNMITKDDNGIYPTLKGFDLQNTLISTFL